MRQKTIYCKKHSLWYLIQGGLMIIGGILLITFAIGLFGWAWRLYQASKA